MREAFFGLKIVIASVLKPLDDTRHYHKLAKTLAEEQGNEVHVMARETPHQQPLEHSNIHFQPLLPATHSVIQRSIAPFHFFLHVLRLEPDLLIVCTHELLLVAALAKYITGCALVYDVQENYVLNIQSNGTYKGWKQRVASFLVKLEEKWSHNSIDQFWLAETCYQTELSIPEHKAVILQNKALTFKEISTFSLKGKERIRLLFTGTVAEETGIWEALALVEKLHQQDPRFELKIVGCCHDLELLERLKRKAALCSFVSFLVSITPITYDEVQKAIEQADIGLVLYRPQANFQDKMPTKVYEYTAMGLIIISTFTLLLKNFYYVYQNGILFHNEKDFAENFLNELENKTFYPNGNHPIEPLLWESEKQKLLEAVKSLT